TETETVTETEEITETEAVTETEEPEAEDADAEDADAEDADAEDADAEDADAEDADAAASGARPLLPRATPEGTPETETDAGEAAGEGRIYFLQPTDNAIIPITSTVVIGYEGVELRPAGESAEGTGHLHILVDRDFVEPGEEIPEDAAHLHLGDGSAETELVLEPGSHILRLQLADGDHVVLEGDRYRDEIVVNVIDGAPEEAVRFVMPTDGAVVPPTFTVVMAATGLSIVSAGPVEEG